jgi:hypothetical protein
MTHEPAVAAGVAKTLAGEGGERLAEDGVGQVEQRGLGLGAEHLAAAFEVIETEAGIEGSHGKAPAVDAGEQA